MKLSDLIMIVITFIVVIISVGLIANGIAGEKGGNLTSGQENILDLMPFLFIVMWMLMFSALFFRIGGIKSEK